MNGRLWICPPTRMDEKQLREEGYYGTFAAAGARTEMPGCSLCMGNQARVEDNATVFSTSTRNFNNRMGKGAQVYLGSAELAAACALLVCMIAGAASVEAADENWPRFRGPDVMGQSDGTNLPEVWGPDKNIAWKVDVPGSGWASPVVWEGKVYVATVVSEVARG